MTIPLVLDATRTDLALDIPVYAYVVGLVAGTFYRLDAQSMPQPMRVSDNTEAAGTFPGMQALDSAAIAVLAPNYPQAWANYAIPLSRTEPSRLDLSQINSANIPGLGTGTDAFSGRVYVSAGLPILPFTVQPDGYAAPTVDGGPGSLCLFDWIEFSYDSEGNFNGNTTQVDQYGFTLTLDGLPGGNLQGAPKVSRVQALASVQTLPAAFSSAPMIVPVPSAAQLAYPAGVSALRAISPKTLTADPLYDGPVAGWFTEAIADWYAAWQQTPLVVNDAATGYYTGVVSDDGVLGFYQGRYDTLAEWQEAAPPQAFALATASLGPISSLDVWQCAGTLASGGTAQLNVGKNIAATFNRGFVSDLLDDTSCADCVGSFYPAGGVWNPWAELFHRISADGLAYGFPYDDLCDQNPSIQLDGTTSVTIALGRFYD